MLVPDMNTDNHFKKALSTLLAEIFDGVQGTSGYILNPGDPGLLRQLDSIDAVAASHRTVPGKTTIAAHADHINYYLSLLNRWSAGESNPWETANWKASWERGVLNHEQWRELRDKLRQAAAEWQSAFVTRADWDETTAGGAVSSAVHTAYHLGAIRQIIAAMGM